MSRKKRLRSEERKKAQQKPASGTRPMERPTVDKWWTDKKILLTIAGILLLVVVSFYPMLNNEITNWDDQLYVTNNELITDLSFSGISEIFQAEVVSNYHPVTLLSLGLNYKMTGLDPSSYLLTNLLLHLLNTFLVFLFIYRLSGKKTSIAIIVSLFFGIHPMHVESVAWISERKDVLYLFFFLLGMLAYLTYLKKPDIKKYILVFLLLVLSLLSKPAAVVFPVLLLLIDYYLGRKFTAKVLLEKLPFFIIALGLGIATVQIQSAKAMEVMSSFDLVERILFSCYGAMIYIVRVIVPWPLAALHPFPQPGELPIIYKLAPVFVLVMAALAIYYRKNKTLIFGLLFYLIAIAPVLQFIAIGNAIIAERYTYLPYIGLFFILGVFYHEVENKRVNFPGGKNALLGLFGVAAVVFMVLAHQRTKVWKNSETLWTDAIEKFPDSHRAYMSRGGHYFDKKLYDPAIKDFTRSLSLYPNYPESLEYRGRTYQILQKYDQALTDFNRWVSIDPQNKDSYNLRGSVLSKMDKLDEAMADFNKTLELDPTNIYALNNRGTLYFNKKREYQKALNDFNQAIAINPDYGVAYLNSSRCYYMLGDKANAGIAARKAQQLGQVVSPEYMQQLK